MKLIVNLKTLRDFVTVDEWIAFQADDYPTAVNVLSHFVVGDDGQRLEQSEARKLIGKLTMTEWDRMKAELKTAIDEIAIPNESGSS